MTNLPFPRISLLSFRLVCACLVLPTALHAAGRDSSEAERAVKALARDQEKAGYVFRAEAWHGEVAPNVGKAIRMQLFKGNDYCVAVAAPRQSGVRISGAVLDFEGKPVGDIQPVLDGWGFILFFKPRRTGLYVVTIHQEKSAKNATAECAVLIGYK